MSEDYLKDPKFSRYEWQRFVPGSLEICRSGDYSSSLMIAKRMLNDAEDLLMNKKWNEAESAIFVARSNLQKAGDWIREKMLRDGPLEGDR